MISIQLDNEAKAYEPGQEISGSVEWLFAGAQESAELRLFWYTKGRGTEDVELVETVPFENLAMSERRRFRLRLPQSPYGFSGKLISLVWSLEFVVQPENAAERLDFVMAPSAEEVRLGP
jgi:hypothetical protein